MKPSWYGESVGHYENGDTLVIDTIGVSPKSYTDNYRTPHTDQLHVVERWKLAADGNRVDVSVFVEDPGAFTTPWSAIATYRKDRTTSAPFTEFVCAENNLDVTTGKLYPIPMAQPPDF